MLIPCPLCGLRDSREFTARGHAGMIFRPAEDASAEEWNAYVHMRDNPAGPTRELWYHGSGCGAWLVVTRDTVTHEVVSAELASDVKAAEDAG